VVTAAHDRSDEVAPSAEDRLAPVGEALQVVCLASQPWHVDLPTNRQQIMARVAQRGHDVLYVQTDGFLGRYLLALVRGPERRSQLRQLVRSDPVTARVRVMKAAAPLPWGHRFRLAARVNAALTARAIRRRVRASGRPTVLWIYDPCFADCVGRCGERLAVYDCVDDYVEQAGTDPRRRALVAAYDELAAARARIVFTTTRSLADRHRGQNPKTHVVRNVGDFDHFAPAVSPELATGAVASLPRPVIGFAGNFLAQKVDFELLEAIALRRPRWSLVLVGPAREDTRAALDRIASREHVHWLGWVPYEELPRIVAGFDVGIIPYVSNAYTASCFPLKTFEYLAAGKPVVASGLPELAGLEPGVFLADDPDAFVAEVERALTQTSDAEVAARRRLAAENTWDTRTGRLLELVAAEL
jgi:glycosyltransferase involved in cell wall biosynthesis